MGFFDLNVPFLEPSSSGNAANATQKAVRIKIVVKAMELGYTGIAYNRTMKGVMSERDRCSIPLLTLSSLLKVAPSLSSSVNFHRDLLGVPRASPFRQYTRLTVCADSPAKSQALNSGNPVLKTYDIVAVRPLNQSAFDHACEKAEVDIISIDFSDKMPFRLKLHMVKAAIERGVYFELIYRDIIVDVQVRRQMISNAKLLVDWTRGQNLVFSSAAPSSCELRGPNDVVNLASLLGLSIKRARSAISENCRTLIANALRRKHFYKEAIRVEALPSEEQFGSEKPWFVDWLKWDPISSGEGDLSLDDMAKSFCTSSKVSKNVKAIDFASVIDSKSNGFHVKDFVSVSETVSQLTAISKNNLSANEAVDMSTTNQVVYEDCNRHELSETDNTGEASAPTEAVEMSITNQVVCEDSNRRDLSEIDNTGEAHAYTTATEDEMKSLKGGSDEADVYVETERHDLHSENCFSIPEVNGVLPNENKNRNLLSQITDRDAVRNAAASLENVPSQISDEDAGRDASEGITLPAFLTSKCSDVHTVEESVDVDSFKGDMVDVVLTEQKHGDNDKIIREEENHGKADIEYMIEEQQQGEVENKIGMLDQKHGEVDSKIMIVEKKEKHGEVDSNMMTEELKHERADSTLSHPSFDIDASLHANFVEGENLTVPGDDAVLAGPIPFLEPDNVTEARDLPLNTNCEAQGEAPMEKQYRGVPDTENKTGKPRERRRIPQYNNFFPLRRLFYPVSFKKNVRRFKRNVKMA